MKIVYHNGDASVAQWIEQWPPEPRAEVRFLSDAFLIAQIMGVWDFHIGYHFIRLYKMPQCAGIHSCILRHLAYNGCPLSWAGPVGSGYMPCRSPVMIHSCASWFL